MTDLKKFELEFSWNLSRPYNMKKPSYPSMREPM